MWPAMFGFAWIWTTLIAAALMCFIVGVLGFLFLIIAKPPRSRPDDLGKAWYRYEEGDFTRPEWEPHNARPAEALSRGCASFPRTAPLSVEQLPLSMHPAGRVGERPRRLGTPHVPILDRIPVCS